MSEAASIDVTTAPLPVPPADALLVNDGDAAALLGISRAFFQRLESSGRLGPMPVHLGRRRLFVVDELRRWCAAGCPPRVKWRINEQ